MLALLVGSVLAVLGVSFVLWPLIRGADHVARLSRAGARATEPVSRDASAIEALREVEFDRATGKISDADYETLKGTFMPLALAELAARERAEQAPTITEASSGTLAPKPSAADAAEALIARAKTRGTSCPEHGPRPEPDALYCSECGGFLGPICGACGAPVAVSGARFCTECGNALAA